MNEQIKNNAEEISDKALDAVTGGFNLNGYEIPNWYVYCEFNVDPICCGSMCKLHGTSDCIEGFCNPSVSKQ